MLAYNEDRLRTGIIFYKECPRTYGTMMWSWMAADFSSHLA